MKQVLVIRPQPAAAQLVEMLEGGGINALSLSLFEYQAHTELNQLPTALKKLHAGDWVIGVSVPAVSYAQAELQAQGLSWPSEINYAAIGDTTAQLLHQFTQQPVITPAQPQTSETFLQHPQIQQITSAQCLILRGDTGRELIKEKLQSQGANITYCASYKKTPINIDIKQDLSAKYQNIDTLIVTSGQQLEYLSKVVEKSLHLWLHTRILYVPSDRIKHIAKRLGFQSIYSVGSAANADFTAILKEHKNSGIN